MAPLAQHGFSHNPPAFLSQGIFQKSININWYLVTPKSCLAHHHITDIYIYICLILVYICFSEATRFVSPLSQHEKNKPRQIQTTLSLRFGLLDFPRLFSNHLFPTLHQPPTFSHIFLTQPKQRPDLGSIIHQQTFRKTLLDEGLCRLRELSKMAKSGTPRGLKSKTRGLF